MQIHPLSAATPEFVNTYLREKKILIICHILHLRGAIIQLPLMQKVTLHGTSIAYDGLSDRPMLPRCKPACAQRPISQTYGRTVTASYSSIAGELLL